MGGTVEVVDGIGCVFIMQSSRAFYYVQGPSSFFVIIVDHFMRFLTFTF